MKNRALFVFLILLPALALSQKKPDSTFTLKILTTVINKDTKIYLAYQINGQKIIDSATQEPISGTYSFSGIVSSPIPATLVADPDGMGLSGLITKTKTGAAVDLLQFYLYPGSIRVETDNLISKGEFRGSIINSDNQNLQLLEKSIRGKQMAISAQLRQATNKQVAHRLGLQLDSLAEAIKPILKEFILENPDSYISLLALQEFAGGHPEIAEVKPLFDRFSLAVKSTKDGKEFYKFLTDVRLLGIGANAPDFVQNDTSGNPVSLSSFRGKYVLLNFWASWCGPCRQEHPALRKIYQDFKGRNFTILGVSLDAQDGKTQWIKAIKNDKLPWTQVSDLKQWDNQAAKLYSVRSIPESFLIDPNGIIIARGLNIQELRRKLEKVLSLK
jgi:peroxiredoxin